MKNHKHFIPNKITLIIFGLFALGLIAYGIFYSYQKKQKTEVSESDILKVALVDDDKDGRFLDSDNDGAYDWVEELWPELDPQNPDSDGDGVLDGKYIQQKQQIREKERLGGIDIESTLTESEKLGRSVYTALLAIEKSGGNLDENTKGQISENIVGYISDLSLGTKLYIREQLDLVEDTKENSYAYRDAMLSFYKKYPVNTSEINLIINATEDPQKYRIDLEDAAIKYDKYINELILMKVPYVIAGRHTELLNTAGQLEGALKNLTLEEYDEVVALASLVQIEKTMNTIVDVNIHIEKYFDIIEDGTIFK